MAPLANRLVSEGYAVWNVEYGRSGERFGGWPHTFDHVIASTEFVSTLESTYSVDDDRVVLLGHSAGGHLALWASTRAEVAGVVALAPIVDFDAAVSSGLGNNAVVDLMGGTPAERPDAYREASVDDQGDVPTVIITSATDDAVPARFSTGVQGKNVERVQLDDVEHLQLINPDGVAADAVFDAIGDLVGRPVS